MRRIVPVAPRIMPDLDDYQLPPEQKRLHEILTKILNYQYSLPDGRAVELEELLREGALSPSDGEFLTSHSITYKPHRLSDYHAGDMFHMPTTDGGCVFVGPAGPPLTKRTAPLRVFGSVVESFLQLPTSPDDLLLHIEFTERDGMGVSPGFISFGFGSARFRERLPAIRRVAVEFNLQTWQDEVVQCTHSLSFKISANAAGTAAATVALLSRGCGLTDDSEITYSAGALDEA